MFVHIYFYQEYEKGTEINVEKAYQILKICFLIMFMNDLLTIFITKTTSINDTSVIVKFIMFAIFFLPMSYSISLLKNLSDKIEGYYKSFLVSFGFWIFFNFVKHIISFIFKAKFVSDLLKLLDTVWIMNFILIYITDPVTNTEENPNAITFYEIYFRYTEFHILILAFMLIYNDRNIDEDVQDDIYSTSAIIGKYDSFRFSVILILAHYLFIFVNGLAFGLK